MEESIELIKIKRLLRRLGTLIAQYEDAIISYDIQVEQLKFAHEQQIGELTNQIRSLTEENARLIEELGHGKIEQ